MVNQLQNVNSGTLEHEAAGNDGSASLKALDVTLGEMLLNKSTEGQQVKLLEFESDTKTDSDSKEELQSVEAMDEESELADLGLEELVLKEGPQQILQLTLQDQTDGFMREEISDSDDYADWIQWVSDAEDGKRIGGGSALCTEPPVLLQMHRVDME
ncbi:unnamed protein product [Sphagnum tenellum]